MTESLVEKMCCPVDKHDLDIKIFFQLENGEIIEALLTCRECNRYYPVIYGIPIMTPDEYRVKAIEAPTLRRWGLSLDEIDSKTYLPEKRK